MNDLIQLPETARKADFATFVDVSEVNGLIAETNSGKKHITKLAGQDLVGKRVVNFVMIRGEGTRRAHGPLLGWKKIVTDYVVEGAGAVYSVQGQSVQNYYVKKA
ncbi:hypothetical protein JN531_012355 [Flagellatimonas centrodinii]|uniref:hypothetical protein n=1 Tax=Flagellatimonas centrodinii TaxID=2806210 RepID=UPI001FEEEB6D|nr:hypothetical protein [Flagellatimonas centrodinii]ULQ45892.1 hypothetical protein JN531_012355 [Flagellatimonas centrodinii]